MIIALFLAAGFIYWETLVPEDQAAIPPKTWSYPNFGVLIAVALIPYFWWTVVFTLLTLLWQQIYGWSAIKAAVHLLPMGVVAFFVAAGANSLAQRVNTKWPILFGQILMFIGSALLAYDNSPGRYWSFAFPGFILGSSGAMLSFVNTNVAIFAVTPPEMAGTIGACFNCALQLGGAVGIAIATSIQSSVEAHKAAGFASYDGRRAAFWFSAAVAAVEAISIIVFFHPEKKATEVEPEAGMPEKKRVTDQSDMSNRLSIRKDGA
jgi:MFS family permease